MTDPITQIEEALDSCDSSGFYYQFSRDLIDDAYLALQQLTDQLAAKDAEIERLTEVLKDIGITAQMASMASPEQFPEYAYAKVCEAISNTGAGDESN